MLRAVALQRTVRPTLAVGCQREFSTALKLQDEVNIKANGRQSVSGVVATVFGGGGFLGRYVVNRLGRIGSQCVIPYRGDGMNVRHLKLMGDLGQIVPLPVDFCDPDTIRKSVSRSNVVINLIGNSHKTINYSYHDTNVKCVYRLASLAKEAGCVKKFIHLSTLGAAEHAVSDLLKSKWEGEQVVKDLFPNATIIRSAPMFGPEDDFFNRYAQQCNLSPIVPVIGGGLNRIQPVYVQDVAQMVVNAITNEKAPGALCEAAGPESYTQSNIIDYIANEIYRPDVGPISVPYVVARLMGMGLDKLVPVKFRFLSQDMVDQSLVDIVESKSGNVLRMSDFGIKPRRVDQEGSGILMRHRGSRVRQKARRLDVSAGH